MRSLAVGAQVLVVAVLGPCLAMAIIGVWRESRIDRPKSNPRRADNTVIAHTPGDHALPVFLDVAIVGRVVEIEPDDLEVTCSNLDPPIKARYKVAVVAIDEALLGASGLTRVRVGFRAESREFGLTLTPHLVGCFSLSRQRDADFYTLVNSVYPEKHERYAEELTRLRKIARTLDDPVAALKARELNDRFDAASILLRRYNEPRFSKEREPIPDEENKLILAILTELPWAPRLPIDGLYRRPDGGQFPNRRDLWSYLERDETRLKRRSITAAEWDDPAFDAAKVEDEVTMRFLKKNADTIQFKRFVQK